MSGLAAVVRTDGSPVDPDRLERVAAALAHRAVDGEYRWLAPDGAAALWHGHFWTTPEEVGERQPLVAGDVALAFDGRVDDRADLAHALGLDEPAAAMRSDAALVLLGYARWGDAVIERLRGPFALALWDSRLRRLLCARDPLGRRTLFHRADGATVVVASEAAATLGGNVAGAAADPVFLAHLFALWPAPRGRTLFASVRELPPCHNLVAEGGAVRLRRRLLPEPAPVQAGRIEEHAAELAQRLERAVARRMRSVGPPAVLMSGGLDSTSVAAFASEGLAARAPGARLRAISYVFDELVDLDERPWIAAMVARHGLDPLQVAADDAWPLADLASWTWYPEGPDAGPFRLLNEGLFDAAREAGHRVLLTGAAGDDHFVSGRASWLTDLVADGRGGEALVELLRHMGRLGPRPVLGSASVRRLVAALIGRAPRQRVPPAWLTDEAARIVADSAPDDAPIRARRTPEDAGAIWSSLGGVGSVLRGVEHRACVEVRDPFADLDVTTFLMSLPAYALYNKGTSKLLLRMAMAQRLPRDLLERPRRSDISALYRRGIFDRGWAAVERLVRREDAVWRGLVRPEAFDPSRMAGRSAHLPVLLWWQCASLEWWMTRAQRRGFEVGSLRESGYRKRREGDAT